ncbi:MAG: urease accessory protein UreF [Pseudomonadota bacterium]
MAKTSSLLRLMSWLSPVFPTGSFAYSAGLEQAIHDSQVDGPETLSQWIKAQLTVGALWNDAIFLAQAHGCATNREPLDDLNELAVAMTNATERLNETIKQGTSFAEAVGNWLKEDQQLPPGTPLPIHIGWASGHSSIDRSDAIAAFQHAFTSNQLQAAIRMGILGQKGAADILVILEPVIETTAKKAASSTLEDLGTCTFLVDIAAMKHESLQPRLFLS